MLYASFNVNLPKGTKYFKTKCTHFHHKISIIKVKSRAHSTNVYGQSFSLHFRWFSKIRFTIFLINFYHLHTDIKYVNYQLWFVSIKFAKSKNAMIIYFHLIIIIFSSLCWSIIICKIITFSLWIWQTLDSLYRGQDWPREGQLWWLVLNYRASAYSWALNAQGLY